MKKTIALLVSLALVLLTFAACGGEAQNEDAPAEKTTIRLATLKGPTGIGSVKLWADNDAGTAANAYTVTLCTDPTEVTAGMIAGSYDVAACPLNMAAVLYNKLEGNVQMLAVNTLGTLYLLSAQPLESIADLAGRTVVTAGQGATPEYVLRYLLEENGFSDSVSVEFRSEHAEVATLAAAATAEDSALYLLPEPNVTSALLQNKALSVALDLSDAFESASGVSLAMGCIVAKKDFVEANRAAVDAFLQEYKASVEYTGTNLDETAALCETYGVIPKAAVAKQAIPRCSIAFQSGAQMQETARANLEVLFAANAQSVGGALPGDDFWYGA